MHKLFPLIFIFASVAYGKSRHNNINVVTVDTENNSNHVNANINNTNKNIANNSNTSNSYENNSDAERHHFQKLGSFKLEEDASLLTPLKGTLESVTPAANQGLETSGVRYTEVNVNFQLLGCLDELFVTQNIVYNKNAPTVDIYLDALDVQSRYSNGVRCNVLPNRTVSVFLKGHVIRPDVHLHFLNADYTKVRVR